MWKERGRSDSERDEHVTGREVYYMYPHEIMSWVA